MSLKYYEERSIMIKLKVQLHLFSLLSVFSAALLAPSVTEAQVLPKLEILQSHDWLDNQDFDWYIENIPFLDTPNDDLDTTWLYRWDMMTKHIIYGSPEHGYASTEFIDRPPWAGTYGTIVCPLGFQLYDMRWFRNPRYVRDYAEYWFKVPGAQAHRYSTWISDSVWAIEKVWPDDEFTLGLLDDLVNNYNQWERQHWHKERQMFWQHGMADGMETNINSRQTKNWFSGAPGFRPTLNSYLYADALAISHIAKRAKKPELSKEYLEKAQHLKKQIQKYLWDPKREFFFHMFRDTETHRNFTIKAGTLTHQTGEFAGSPHGRELIGYIPWQFNIPEAKHDVAWKFLMNPDVFFAKRGPTVTERKDPLFRISPNCCVWSGNSWPFATGQTLKALANVLQSRSKLPISKKDYFKILDIYSLTHRKDGKPYIAEACHPDTGSWKGHDHYNHSEHYFHSTFIDLIVTGLVGLIPSAENKIEMKPLIPDDWNYFCMDGVEYKGHSLTIIWDKTGEKYKKGKGLIILSSGKEIYRQDSLEPFQSELQPQLEKARREPPDLYNFAVNNSFKSWPRVLASSFDYRYPPYKMIDGQFWYLESPPNRWQPRVDDASPYFGVDFGLEREVSEVKIYLLDGIADIKTPKSFSIEVFKAGKWASVKNKGPKTLKGRTANTFSFENLKTQKIRVRIAPQENSKVAISELEVWGPGQLPFKQPESKSVNLAAGASIKASTFNHPDPPAKAIDGIINYDLNGGPNRWATERRPNDVPAEKLGSDWLEIEFKEETTFSEVRLHFCRSRWGMGSPTQFEIQIPAGDSWQKVKNQTRYPKLPQDETINVIQFPAVKSKKVRLLVYHGKGKPVTALSELEILNPS